MSSSRLVHLEGLGLEPSALRVAKKWKRSSFDPTEAWAGDINESGRFRATVERVKVRPGAKAKATSEVWDDGAPVAKAFKNSRRREIPSGTHDAVVVNDGTVYIYDGRWWYQAIESDLEF